jgi:N-glycosylase/DNA lyase
LEVKDSKADMVLIESYQNGQLLQATLRGSPKEWWWQFIEVTDKKEIERLIKLYEKYQEYP